MNAHAARRRIAHDVVRFADRGLFRTARVATAPPKSRPRLRNPRGAGPGRHGRRLQGPARPAQPPGRAEDDPGGRPRRRVRSAAVPAEAEAVARLAASQHRPGLRDRRARAACLLARWSSVAGGTLGRTVARHAAAAAGGGPAGRSTGPGHARGPPGRASSTAT